MSNPNSDSQLSDSRSPAPSASPAAERWSSRDWDEFAPPEVRTVWDRLEQETDTGLRRFQWEKELSDWEQRRQATAEHDAASATDLVDDVDAAADPVDDRGPEPTPTPRGAGWPAGRVLSQAEAAGEPLDYGEWQIRQAEALVDDLDLDGLD